MLDYESTSWEIEIQIMGGDRLTPFEWPLVSNMKTCIDYLRSNSKWLANSSGLLVQEIGVENIFWKIDDNGELETSSVPYPGLKYNIVNKPC